uniref:Uncharacterized protein n=1 Tax=Myoviridae sp. ctnzH2 TaxID=2827707 RepID=A0A8S5S7J0_9CAUD|nr:MAG TPA: hypothetical protein [Myoviridae sp. ctnzH2]
MLKQQKNILNGFDSRLVHLKKAPCRALFLWENAESLHLPDLQFTLPFPIIRAKSQQKRKR